MAFVGIATLSAQTSNGTVVGVVTDKTGATVQGATITITSVETGAVRNANSGSDGTYRIDSVLPGTYNVSVSAAGFATTVKEGQVVPSSSTINVSAVLAVGQASDRVEVSADNATLNTDNAQLSGTISEMEVSNLPISSLNPYQLALTLPGVMNTTQGGFSNGVDYNVGGGRPRANNFLIEGQDNNDAGIQGQGLQPGNDDAIKEVVIIENAYTAEYGHGAGSVANVIYKSGTNDFHGSLYYRFQNQALDALDKNDVYNQDLCIKQGGTSAQCAAEKSKYRENMPGFAVGGPIKRNKLFFFASNQWDYYRSSKVLGGITVPTAAGYATMQKYAASSPSIAQALQAFGDIPTAHAANIIGPFGKLQLGPDPVTGAPRGFIETGVYHRNVPVQYDSPELDLKGDYIATSKDTLTLRYIHTSFTAPIDVWNFCCQLPGFDTNQNGASHNAGFTEVHTFSPTVVNELRASYGRIGFEFGLPASTTSNALFGKPSVSGTGFSGWGVPTSMPQGRFHNTYQLQDTISWTHGKHFFKFGEDIESVRVRDEIPFNYYGSIAFARSSKPSVVAAPGGGTQSVTYSATANFLDNYSGNAGSVAQNFGNGVARPQLLSQNYFATDTYHPLPTLSLDMGLRYEYNGAPFNTAATPYPGWDPNMPDCYPITATGTQNCNTKQKADTSQWGPRAGIAWSPTLLGQHKTVVRLGYGVFYDVVFTNIIDNIQATAPNNASPQLVASGSSNNNRGASDWIHATSRFTAANKVPSALGTDEPIYNHLRSPRTQHYNLNIQQELPWATTLQVGYVGERGTHLFGNSYANPFVNQYVSSTRKYANRGPIIVRDNSVDSEYSGLWVEADHKFNHDFLFRASYTLGKAMDDGSEIFSTGTQSSYQITRYGTPRGTLDWGPSAYDHRQRLVLSYIWQPHVWHTEGSMRIVGNIVNRWAIAGISQFQSGTVHNVQLGTDINGDGVSNDRPNLGNPKAPVNTYAFDDSWYTGKASTGTLCSGPSLWSTNDPCHTVTPDSVHWIVPALGSEPTGKTIGRNSLYGPGYQQWDLNLQRSFKITERIQLDFRGELINAFNHGSVDTNGFIMNSTLASGINQDQWNNVGQNYFMNPTTYVNGNRHARLYGRIRF